MNQLTISPSTDRDWIQYYQRQAKKAENRLIEILNLYRRDDAFVAKKGSHWAYMEVRNELALKASKPSEGEQRR